jgi:hypothetical protein
MSTRSLKHRKVHLKPVGADGSAVATHSLNTGAAVVRFIAVDYSNQPATTDLVIKADGSGGDTLFTVTNGNTDIAAKPVSMTAGVDEAAAALAATDGSAGGVPVKAGLHFDVAQADSSTAADHFIEIDVWYESVKYIKVESFPVGADGAAVDTKTVRLASPGIIRAIKVDYQNQPVTTDILIKAENTSGTTLFTRTSSATDIALSPVGMPGVNESNAALAATDASDGGWPVKGAIFIDVAEGDGQTSGDEKIVFEFWIDT